MPSTRVSSLAIFPAYGVGVIGYAIEGPLAAAFGPAAVFAVGAAYGLLSSAAALTLPSVRAVRWQDRKAPVPVGARAGLGASGRAGLGAGGRG